MKNVVVIFAGGTGSRMGNTDKPKQFLEVDGKPIIVHTIEKFNNCDIIDAISISILEEYIPLMEEYKVQFGLDKIEWIVSGGDTGQLSIFNGLDVIKTDDRVDEDAVVLIHDGVRPIIDENLILMNIAKARTDKSSITVVKAIETVFESHDHEKIDALLDRSILYNARAPQTFFLNDLHDVHKQEMDKGNFNNIDSCSMMFKYDFPLNFVIGNSSNIKITNYEDYYIFKTLYELDKMRHGGETLK